MSSNNFRTLLIVLVLCIQSSFVKSQNKDIVSKIDSVNCTSHDTIVQINVEKSAKFQNGDLLMFKKYLAMNIRYPFNEMISKCQGKSYIRFVVDWDGQVKDVTVYKSSGNKNFDNEAVRVIKQSPIWTSAKNNNVCVPQQFILPVVFKNLGVIN